jgi:hypothetical protein
MKGLSTAVLTLFLAATQLASLAAVRPDGFRPPSNLQVDPVLKLVVERMWQASPTFRRQCRRLAAEQGLQVRVSPDDQPTRASLADARTALTFQGNLPVAAHVYLRPSSRPADRIETASPTFTSTTRNRTPRNESAAASSRTELISRTQSGRTANGNSLRPALSFDGSTIAFQSLATNLVCESKCQGALDDINLLWDVFVHDRRTNRTTRMSADGGDEWMENSRGPSIDGAGHVLAFGRGIRSTPATRRTTKIYLLCGSSRRACFRARQLGCDERPLYSLLAGPSASARMSIHNARYGETSP